MNVELLKKIKRRILREPQRFRMDVWSCGSAHCICGWACFLSGLKPVSGSSGFHRAGLFLDDGRDTESVSYELLGVDQQSGLGLSAVELWPEFFRSRYQRARTRKQRAQIAAERIDRFIATNGR